MIHRIQSPARLVPVLASLVVSVGFFAACGEPVEASLVVTESHALAACDNEASCEAASDAASPGEMPEQDASTGEEGWVSRCETDAECSIGQCVCGVCTESCNGEPDACSGLPAGATCFSGRSLPRAALCHATTVAGICLQACNSDDECGDGVVCALGACLPEPSE